MRALFHAIGLVVIAALAASFSCPCPAAPSISILFSRSVDGGQSYSTPIRLSLTGTSVSGAMPVVGPNGELYVAWEDRSGAQNGRIIVRKSTDGGATWGSEITAATFTRISDSNASAACERPAVSGNIRVNDFPSIDVARGGATSGNVYITYAADPDGNQATGDDADVFFVRSTDGGATWSTPVAINKGPAVAAGADATLNDNFFPFVSVGPGDTVNVVFYDRRRDGGNIQLDLFRSSSADGGLTWINQRLTNTAFGVPPLNPNFDPVVVACYMGDYNWSIGLNPAWGDNRRVVTTPGFPTGRPDPDVFFWPGVTLFADVQVNNPAGDPGNNTTQSETSIARMDTVVVVGFNDSGQFTATNSLTGYAYSFDGGNTFTDAGVLAPVAGGLNLGDPALAVDAAGNFYFATLAQDAAGNSFIGVAKSTAIVPAVTFGPPVLIPGLVVNGFQDKELIAADATGGTFSGNVYVVWTEFP